MIPIAFIIQARTGSSRLPNKMMMTFQDDLNVPEIIIQKLVNNFPEIPVFLATTNSKKDDLFAERMTRTKAKVYRGSEDNVLDRFVEIVKANRIDKVIRICADNPFLDMGLLEELLNVKDQNYDYIAHKIGGKPCMKTGLGFFAELTTSVALKKAAELTQKQLYVEHVTNFIYENPNLFDVKWLNVSKLILENSNIRLTVDTVGDFNTASYIFKALKSDNSSFGYKEIISFVRQEDTLVQAMMHETKLNQK